jgi:hypothetical protein
MGQWLAALILFLIWFVLRVIFHKSGMVHVLLLSAIAVFVVQLAAVRKTRYHQSLARNSGSESSS